MVYVLAEGPGDHEALPVLIERAVPTHVIDTDVQSYLPAFADPPKSVKGKWSDSAFRAVVLAESMGWDLVVGHLDADARADKGGKAPGRFSERRKALLDGAVKAHAGASAVVPFVAAVPVRMLEAWLLADQSAIRSVIPSGAFAAPPPTKIGRPEELGGEPDDPQSDYPKFVLERLLGFSADSSVQCGIASVVNVATLRTRCPASFAVFYDDLQVATKYW